MMRAATVAKAAADERVLALDVLRGVAIVAILFVNVPAMGGSFWAAGSDPQHYGWSALDRLLWGVRAITLDGTARGLLELLFGAGVVILTDRWTAAHGARSTTARFVVRTLLLLVMGLAHVFILLWPGDILHTYALAALVVFAFRRLDATSLLAFGLVYPLLEFAGGAAAWLAGGAMVDPKSAHMRVVAEDVGRSSDFVAWAEQQWQTFLTLQRWGLEVDWVFEAAAVMLIGAACYKSGVLQGARSRRFYAAMAVAGYAMALVPRVRAMLAQGHGDESLTLALALAEPARIAMTLGHVGAVHLLLGSVAGSRLLAPFAPAGRAALSIYLAQSVICLWLVYPPFGLALYGRHGWAELMVVALTVNLLLLLAAGWWMRRFRIAPVEWAWRSFAEWRLLPWR